MIVSAAGAQRKYILHDGAWCLDRHGAWSERPNPGAVIQPPAPGANKVNKKFAILRGKGNYTQGCFDYTPIV